MDNNNKKELSGDLIMMMVMGVLLLVCFGCMIFVSIDSKKKTDKKDDSLIAAQTMDEILDQAVADESASGEDADEEPVGGNGKTVYLTFDDGPSIYTGQILDILAANDVKATFFVIGREGDEYKPYYKRIVDEGHTLAMHSYSHDYKKLYGSKEDFDKDFEKIYNLIYETTGQEPKYYRFPGGSSNQVSKLSMQVFIKDLNDRGIVYYDWNAMNGDAMAKEKSEDELIQIAMSNCNANKGDSIVLMHDHQGRHSTVDSLQELIDKLKEAGFSFDAIDDNAPVIQHVKEKEE